MTDFSPPVSPRFCPFLLFLGSSDVNHLMCGNRRSLAPSNYRLRRHCTITAIVPRSTHPGLMRTMSQVVSGLVQVIPSRLGPWSASAAVRGPLDYSRGPHPGERASLVVGRGGVIEALVLWVGRSSDTVTDGRTAIACRYTV
jgi:hypothetical protein